MKANATQLIKVLVSELQNYEETVKIQEKSNKELKSFLENEFKREIKVDSRQFEALIRDEQKRREEDIEKLSKEIKKGSNGMFYSLLLLALSVFTFYLSYQYKSSEIENFKAQNSNFRQFLFENPKNAEVYDKWNEQIKNLKETNEKSN